MTSTPVPGPTAAPVPRIGAVRAEGFRYERAPMIVYWETTIACPLACTHCRATAMPYAAPGQLTTDECLRLLDSMVGFGNPRPHVVFTGGDPLERADLEQLVRHATSLGIGSSLAPAVAPGLTRERMLALKEAGIQAVSLSLDGSTPEKHDGLRGVPGTFDRTMEAIEMLNELDLPVQINTLITDTTHEDLPAVYDVLRKKKLLRWALFFLIATGRGSTMKEISAGEAERLMNWFYDLSRVAPFQVKTTEATHYRRVAMQRMEAEGHTPEEIASSNVARGFGIRDGNGICFINHKGDVFPSGFLPVKVGNVRETDLVTLYRENETFRALRDTSRLGGRCGECTFHDECGGSRSRAYAHTGDLLAEDPLCPHEPKAYAKRLANKAAREATAREMAAT